MSQQTIDRYTIEEKLGQGGMGHVYKAFDSRFERYVAIKVMPDAMTQEPSFRARFEREAKIIANLQHPGIVPVHDFGEDNGELFLVMRYMAGGSLRDRLEEGPLPIKETAKIMNNICHALDSAHQEGIIHRDLKPANILLDQYGHAYLADFGIARLTSAATRLTETNAVMGTPAYMSPEQVRADRQIDQRSDIYALGIIFYEMLTGLVPYKAESSSKTMLMHVLEPVPSIIEIRPEFPYQCELILQAALAKDKMARYQTAVAFAHDIREMVKGAQRGRPRPQQPPPTTKPTPFITSEGHTVDETFIESQILSSGNDLVDDVLSYYAKSNQDRVDERAQQIRDLKRKEEADLQARQKQYREEAERRQVAQAAAAEKQRRQFNITLAISGVVLLIVLIIIVIILTLF